VIGVKVEKLFVQKMKTKWGSCNSASKSIRLNTDLAKKPPQCLEYIVVHEMAHFIVRHHNEQFGSVMDKCLPGWRQLRQMLNDAPLAHADWTY
jgi:predicted metal-dependent hydrolase